MILLLGLLLIFALGFLLITLLGARLILMEKIGLALVIGLGLATKLVFYLDVLKVKYSVGSILLTLLAVVLVLAFILRTKLVKIWNNRKHPSITELWKLWLNLPMVEKVLIFALGFLLFSTTIQAVFWPVWLWDALALYDYRGRLFADAGGIVASIGLSSLPLHTYPPMTSLAHAIIYVLGGKQANPQFIYPMFYLVLLLTFYASVRKYSPRWFALLMSLLLLSIPAFVSFAANAYTNLPYAFYFGMGTVYLYRFIKEEKVPLLIISGLLFGLSGWTRTPTEQFFLVNVLVLVVWCVMKRRFYWTPLLLIVLFSLLSVDWRIFVAIIFNLSAGQTVGTEVTTAMSAGLSGYLDPLRFMEVVWLLLNSIKGVNGTGFFLIILMVVFFRNAMRKNFLLLSIILLNFFMLAAGSYLFSLSWRDWEDSIKNSADRLSMIFPPIILYYIAVTIPLFEEKIPIKGLKNQIGKSPKK